jgi:hypothetical protein
MEESTAHKTTGSPPGRHTVYTYVRMCGDMRPALKTAASIDLLKTRKKEFPRMTGIPFLL